MKITNKQVLMLFETAKDTLAFANNRTSNDIFTFNLKTRIDLVNQIINQQSNEIKDLSKKGGC